LQVLKEQEDGIPDSFPEGRRAGGPRLKVFLFSPSSMGGPSIASWCSTQWTVLRSLMYNVTLPPAVPMSLSPGSMASSKLSPTWSRDCPPQVPVASTFLSHPAHFHMATLKPEGRAWSWVRRLVWFEWNFPSCCQTGVRWPGIKSQPFSNRTIRLRSLACVPPVAHFRHGDGHCTCIRAFIYLFILCGSGV
jgi:hypothetical protein